MLEPNKWASCHANIWIYKHTYLIGLVSGPHCFEPSEISHYNIMVYGIMYEYQYIAPRKKLRCEGHKYISLYMYGLDKW